MAFLPDFILPSVSPMVSKDGHFCKNCVRPLETVIFTGTRTFSVEPVAPPNIL